MKNYIHGVVGAGIDPKKFNIKHVGNPAQRVPVPTVALRERPPNIRRGQAGGYELIFSDVFVVVKIKKLKIKYGAVEVEGGKKKQAAEQRNLKTGIWFGLGHRGINKV